MSLAPPYWRCQHGAKCFVPCPGCPGPLIGFPSELQRALQEDGEKLRQLTGKDHGPVFIGVDMASGPDITAVQFQCAVCGEIFDKAWSDEDAAKELEQTFPGFTTEECALVCDDCVNKMTGGDDVTT